MEKDKSQIGYVYIHSNNMNGKCYVGQTIHKPESRWKNGKGYIGCPLFFRAIEKYGWDNFSHKVFELPIDQLDWAERFLIECYKTDDPRYGYNIENGGHNNKRISQETKEKLRLTKLGEKNPNYRKHPSEETRKRMRDSNAKSKSCLQFSKDGVFIAKFSSMCEAERKLGICNTNIAECCKGKRVSAGGYIWKYNSDNSKAITNSNR